MYLPRHPSTFFNLTQPPSSSLNLPQPTSSSLDPPQPHPQEFWAELSASLPSGKDKGSQMLRKKLFKQFDSQGNGYLSLAEIDKGISDVTTILLL